MQGLGCTAPLPGPLRAERQDADADPLPGKVGIAQWSVAIAKSDAEAALEPKCDLPVGRSHRHI